MSGHKSKKKKTSISPRGGREASRNWGVPNPELAINREREVVVLIEECHWHWRDLAGYVWGCRKERAQAPIRNEKRKQTYFGALNAKTQKTTVKSSPTGNSENTIDFLETLRWQHPDQKLLSFGREPLLIAASNSGTIYRLSIPIPHQSRLIAFA